MFTINFPEGSISFPVSYLRAPHLAGTLFDKLINSNFAASDEMFLMFKKETVINLIPFIRDGVLDHDGAEFYDLLDYVCGENVLIPRVTKKYVMSDLKPISMKLHNIRDYNKLCDEETFVALLRENFDDVFTPDVHKYRNYKETRMLVHKEKIDAEIFSELHEAYNSYYEIVEKFAEKYGSHIIKESGESKYNRDYLSSDIDNRFQYIKNDATKVLINAGFQLWF